MENGINSNDSKKVVIDYFEQTIFSVQFDYTYCRKTKSYASVLWLYGMFLINYKQDFINAVKYLEESRKIFEEVCPLDVNYFKLLAELIRGYIGLYKRTKDISYRDAILSTYAILDGLSKNGYKFHIKCKQKMLEAGIEID